VPDKIFGIRDREQKTEWFFCLEADTGSETLEPRQNLAKYLKEHTTWLGKSLQYKATWQSKAFEKRFNIPAFRVLLVTTPEPETHLGEMMKKTLKAYEGHPTRMFLFTTIDKILERSPLEVEWLQADGTKKKLLED